MPIVIPTTGPVSTAVEPFIGAYLQDARNRLQGPTKARDPCLEQGGKKKQNKITVIRNSNVLTENSVLRLACRGYYCYNNVALALAPVEVKTKMTNKICIAKPQ